MFRRTDVETILNLQRDDILSIYLNVDPTLPENQSTQPAYRIWLKNALDGLAPRPNNDQSERQQRLALSQMATKIMTHFVDFRPQGKGVVLFAAEDYWQEFDLPVPISNKIHYGRPDVVPLLWLLDEYERYGIVQVDHRRVELLTAFLGRPEAKDEMRLELDTSDWPRTVMIHNASNGPKTNAGTNRDVFEDRVDEQVRGFWREAAVKISAWVEEANLERLIFGGNEEAVSGLKTTLPEAVGKRVIGTLSLPFYENDATTLQRVTPLAIEYERKHEKELVEQVINYAMAGGRGAVGQVDVFDALQQGRAQTVVAAMPIEGQVWECQNCHRIADHEIAICPTCSGAVRQRQLATTLPLLAAQTNATLEMVYDEAAELVQAYGGIGALLRY
ncbi:MAG: hypothetical protein EXR62_15775 [Chloroflexi bacterium]|nr:hypothetical protein [Chloroflexota bacterium]